jgi:hypothetical protein
MQAHPRLRDDMQARPRVRDDMARVIEDSS